MFTPEAPEPTYQWYIAAPGTLFILYATGVPSKYGQGFVGPVIFDAITGIPLDTFASVIILLRTIPPDPQVLAGFVSFNCN